MHNNVHNIVNKIVFMDTFVLIFLLYSFVFIKMNLKKKPLHSASSNAIIKWKNNKKEASSLNRGAEIFNFMVYSKCQLKANEKIKYKT